MTLSLLKKPIRKQTVFWLAAMLSVNILAYFVTRPFTEPLPHYEIATAFDNLIPLVPIFILPYILAYLQWGLGYFFLFQDDMENGIRIARAEILAKVLVGITFCLFPTMIVRPEVVPTGLWNRLVAFIYEMDAPNNLFPSIHCLESWFVLRGTLKMKSASRAYCVVMGVMTLLVFLSTVFVKQHVVWDMLGAVLYAEFALLVWRMLLGRKRPC